MGSTLETVSELKIEDLTGASWLDPTIRAWEPISSTSTLEVRGPAPSPGFSDWLIAESVCIDNELSADLRAKIANALSEAYDRGFRDGVAHMENMDKKMKKK